MTIRDLEPGQVRIRCPHCAEDFLLKISEDLGTTVGLDSRATEAAAVLGSARASTGEPVARGRFGRYWAGEGNEGRALGIGPKVGLRSVDERSANRPRFVARWLLEAFAASKLRHPNLVTPIEVGIARGRPYAASVEDRDAVPLTDPGRGRGDLDRIGRIASILQAARGLRHAHEQAIYHRAIDLGAIESRPADGLVRLRGVGLNLSPTDPEPSPSAVRVPGVPAPPLPAGPDPSAEAIRRDIAGLGRALETLVAGTSRDRGMPAGLARLIRRMVGDEPGVDPIRDMGGVIRALEVEAGIGEYFDPPEAELDAIADASAEFAASPLLPARTWIGPSLLAMVASLAGLLMATGRVVAGLGWIAFASIVIAGLVAFRAWDRRSGASRRRAEAFASIDRLDAVAVLGAATIVIVTLSATHLLWTWGFLALIGIGLSAGYHFALDRPINQHRTAAVERARSLIKAWRLRGIDESDIRRTFAQHSGHHWEEWFGVMFGGDAVGEARRRGWSLDPVGRPRPRFASWRNWAIGRFDAWVASNRREADLAWLGPTFERDREARGVMVLTARRRSVRIAEAIVGLGDQYRGSADESVGLPLATALGRAVDRPEDFLASPEIAEAGEEPAWRRGLEHLASAFLGPKVRFLLGFACLAASVVWFEQNNYYSYERVKAGVVDAVTSRDRAVATDRARAAGQQFLDKFGSALGGEEEAEPIALGGIPPFAARHLNGYGLLVAGLILLRSAARSGLFIVPFSIVGAAIPVGPKLVDPSSRPLDASSLIAMAAGVGALVAGLVLDRRRG